MCTHMKAGSSNFLATFAIKCTSWSSIYRGTSQRSACASFGNVEFPSVSQSNCMGCRILIYSRFINHFLSSILVKAENVCWSPIYSCLLQPQPNLRTTYLAMRTTRRLLVSRTALSSVLEFFPIFRDFLCKLFYAHGGSCLETQFIERIYG